MAKNNVIIAIHKRHIDVLRCKLPIVDKELFFIARYLLNGKITITGITNCNSSLAIYHSATVITMSENDWRLLHKAKPLIMKCLAAFDKKGFNFEKSNKVLRLF